MKTNCALGKQTRASLAAAAEGENAPTDPRIAKPDLPHSIAWGTQVQIYTYETSLLRKGALDFFVFSGRICGG